MAGGASRETGHVEIVLDGRKTVVPTFTCSHCQRIVERPKINEDAGFCMKCFRPTCVPCGRVDVCVPWEQQCERIEARARARASIDAAIARMNAGS